MSKKQLNNPHRRRFMNSVGLTAGLVTLSASFAASTWAQEAPPEVPIGQVVAFTGSGAEYGVFYRDAAKLALDQINVAAEEVFGGPIVSRLIAEDSNTLPTPAIEAARKLVEADGVPAVIAAWSSGVTVAIATSVTIPSGVLQVGNGTTSPLVSILPEDAEADLLFRTSPSDALQGVVAADLAAGNLIDDYKFSTAATIYINNPYGQGLSNAFTAAFEKRGGTVLAEVAHPEEVQPTYRSQLSAALKDNPDILILPTYPAHTAAILKESRDIFDYTNWQFTDANRSSEVLDAVGGADLVGKLGTVPSADPESESYKSFAEAYKAAYGHDRIPPFSETTYDAGMVIGLALAKAIADGITDPAEITGRELADRLRPIANAPGETIIGGSQAEITKALQMIKDGQDIDYVGAGGSVDFDENGDVKTPVAIWQFTETGDETINIVPAEQIASE
ncbi:ABC transporter substrate-binding protein [Pontibaca salina]|uniref:ABC transporter substrate-binding protein n=1 Tax=Pontibaca salina TaxID=2795731 RepID=A0A934HIK0_9RHOB|nr:ABC transporter substrate-binding protein [Pontibaca salina]MBI6628819.1 ABC transporter substrate-binding protein [Pontibaca salina]